MPQHPSTLFLGDIINSFNHIHRFCWEHINNSPILTHLLLPGGGLLLFTLSLKMIILDPNQKSGPSKGLSSIDQGRIFQHIFAEYNKGGGVKFQPTESHMEFPSYSEVVGFLQLQSTPHLQLPSVGKICCNLTCWQPNKSTKIYILNAVTIIFLKKNV